MQTYFMVGAGGTGSHLMPGLLAYLKVHHNKLEGDAREYQVVVADGDAYEAKNLERQLFDAGLTTVNKADAMVLMNPDHPIIAVNRFIGETDVQKMMQDGDVILICVDNFSIRHTITHHVKNLKDVVVINAGNEKYDGSVQLWVRQDGENITPPITYLHPEIQFIATDDRAAMTCVQAAQLPGGEQTLLANQAAAHHMLAALARFHSGAFRTGWTELNFDTVSGEVVLNNMRERRNWQTNP